MILIQIIGEIVVQMGYVMRMGGILQLMKMGLKIIMNGTQGSNTKAIIKLIG